MKNNMIVILLSSIILCVSCTNQSDQKKSVPDEGKINKIVKQYTCTMHADVLKDKPGICPKCGMELVEKESN